MNDIKFCVLVLCRMVGCAGNDGVCEGELSVYGCF